MKFYNRKFKYIFVYWRIVNVWIVGGKGVDKNMVFVENVMYDLL